MEYVLGGLVGVVVAVVFSTLVANYGYPRKRDEDARRAHEAFIESCIKENAKNWKRIADAVEVWQARYVRRKKGKVEMKGAENDGN